MPRDWLPLGTSGHGAVGQNEKPLGDRDHVAICDVRQGKVPTHVTEEPEPLEVPDDWPVRAEEPEEVPARPQPELV